MGKKFVDLANLKSNLENFFSEIISPTFVTKEAVTEQLGNHTVKSDVPENAVFTDTIYDDTDVKEEIDEINSNLADYGLDNKFDGIWTQGIVNKNGGIDTRSDAVSTVKIPCSSGDLIHVKTEKTYEWFVITCVDSNGAVTSRTNNSGNLNIKEFSAKAPANTTGYYVSVQNTSGTVSPSTVGKVNIYINNAIDELKNDLNTLEFGEVAGGKNLLNPNKFLNWVNQYTTGRYSNDEITISPVNVYLYNNFFKFSDTDIDVTLSIKSLTFENGSNPRVCLVNSAGTIIGTVTTNTPSTSGLGCGIKIDFTDLPTSITIKELMIEESSVATEYEPYFPSNKMLTEEKADKSETTVNRLNPKLQTTTKDGVTCTNNGDGTYTLNGTAVSTTYFFVQGITYLAKNTTNKYYKLVGCPTGGMNKYDLRYEINGSTANGGGKDFGNGVIIKNDKINSTDITSAEIIITVLKDVTVNNLVFKPMLTTNLDATYDDFVPYTGDTGKLNSDVAEVRKDINSIIPADTSSITLTVTNSDIKEYVPSITFSREADSEKGIKTVNLSLTVGSGSGNVTGISGTLNEEELQKLQSMKIPTLFTNGNIIAFFGISQGTSKTYRFNLMLYIKNPEGEIGVYNNHSPVKESISIKSLL